MGWKHAHQKNLEMITFVTYIICQSALQHSSVFWCQIRNSTYVGLLHENHIKISFITCRSLQLNEGIVHLLIPNNTSHAHHLVKWVYNTLATTICQTWCSFIYIYNTPFLHNNYIWPKSVGLYWMPHVISESHLWITQCPVAFTC